ncbi:tetratricopeptide repeat protein [Planctomycetota bacterium]
MVYAIELDPDSWQAYADRVQVRLQEVRVRDRRNEKFAARYGAKEQIRQAIADCDRALQLDGSASTILLDRAELCQRLGDSGEAEATHRRFAELDAEPWGAYLARARLLRAGGDTATAAALLDRAILLRDDDARLYANRAAMLARLGRPDEAIEDLDRAIELEPKNPSHHFGRSHMVQYYRGDMQTALVGFSRAIELDPAFGMNYYGRALTWLDGELRDPEKALRDLELAIEHDSGHHEPFVLRGELRLDGGDVAGALSDYEVASKRLERRGASPTSIMTKIEKLRARLTAEEAEPESPMESD